MPVYKNFYLLKNGKYLPSMNSFSLIENAEYEKNEILKWPAQFTIMTATISIDRGEVQSIVTEIDNDHAMINSIDTALDGEIPW